MNFNCTHLTDDELSYELQLRGCCHIGSHAAKLALLQAVFRAESDGAGFEPCRFPFLTTDEISVCRHKADELAQALMGEVDCSRREVLSARLGHLQNRVRRIDGDAHPNEMIELRSKIILLHDQLRAPPSSPLEESLISFDNPFPTSTDVTRRVADLQDAFRRVSIVPPSASSPSPALPSVHSTANPFALTSVPPRIHDSPVQHNPRSPYISSKPISSWGFRFDGQNMSVGAFLERVSDLSRSRGVSSEQLFEQASELFEGDVSIWFRRIRHETTSWEELTTRLRTTFQDPHYDLQLLQEIERRTQGDDERLSIYISKMEGYFNRLSTPLDESRRLEIITRNMLPSYQLHLSLIPPTSIQDLETRGLTLEACLYNVKRYRSPSTSSSGMLEPDLVYRSTTPRDRRAIHRPVVCAADDGLPSVDACNTRPPRGRCWNCDQPGHMYPACREPRQLFCFGCGMKNVTSRRCPKCSSRPKKRRSPAGCGGPSGRPSALKTNQSTKNIAALFTSVANDDRPYLEVRLADQPVLGLVDTGSCKTIVGGRKASLFKSHGFKIRSASVKHITTADGAPHSVLGEVEVNITLRNVTRRIPVIIVPSLTQLLILGIDFCKSFGLGFDCAGNSWKFVASLTPATNHTSRELSTEQQQQLATIVQQYDECGRQGLGRAVEVQHHIDTGNAEPIRQDSYRLSPYMREHLYKELDVLLEQGIVRKSTSAWRSPVLLVPKSTGEYRMCFDGRKLNSVTVKDAYPLPNISRILDSLYDARFLSSIDLKSAFHQIPLAPDSCQKTAFVVEGRGLFEFTRMPFGLCNAPQTQQRLMDQILGPELAPNVFVYLDDIVIVSATFEQHLALLKDVLKRLKAAGLTVNAKKCEFLKPQLKFLGFIVDSHGLRTDPDKIAAVVNFPSPSTSTQLRRFLGMASWYRRFIPEYSSIASPLTDLLKGAKKGGKIQWSKAASQAFVQVKNALASSPVLASPDFSQPFHIQTDASDTGLGGVLTQGSGEDEKVIAYVSRTLSRSERAYTVTEKECLAVVFAVEKFRPYIEGVHFTVTTDHYSLLWLQRLKNPTGLLARWAVRLQAFNFTMQHRRGHLNVVADALSRAPVDCCAVTAVRHDKWYQKMLRQVTEHPDDFPEWRVEQQHLYRHVIDYQPDQSNLPVWKYVAPQAERRAIIQQCHDPSTSGHFGVFKTLRRIQDQYYWPRMIVDVRKYIQRCRTCLAQKVPQLLPPGLMGKPKPVQFPWQLISLDLLGPFPRSRHGHTFILIIADWFTKYTLLFPLRRATVPRIVQLLEEEVFLIYGVPQTIVCDNGTQFISRDFKALAKKYNVTRIWYNAKYHPQVNPSERCNRVVMTAIRSYIGNDHRDWDRELKRIAHAMRTAVHEVTGYTPAFLNFGRHITLDGSRYGSAGLESQIDERDPYAKKLTDLPLVYTDVRRRLHEAYRTNSKYYNLRRRSISYAEGDIVWVRTHVLSNAARGFSAKLAPKYKPGIVTKKLSGLVYQLSDEQGHDIGRWHVKDMKPDPHAPDVDGLAVYAEAE